MKQNLEKILNQEGVIRNEPAMLIKSENITENGRLILTSKRLVFVRNLINTSPSSRYFINEQNLDQVIDIDLDLINTLSRENYLVDPNALVITYMQYKEARFTVMDYENWEKDIQAARMHPDIPGDPNKEENK